MFLFSVTDNSPPIVNVTLSPLDQYKNNKTNAIIVSKNLHKFYGMKIFAIIILITTIIAILLYVIPICIKNFRVKTSVDEESWLTTLNNTLESIFPIFNICNSALIVGYGIFSIILIDQNNNNQELLEEFINQSEIFIKEYETQNTLVNTQNTTITQNNKSIQEYQEDLKTLKNEFNEIHSAMEEIYKNLFYETPRISRTQGDINAIDAIKTKNQEYLNKFKPTTLKMVELINTIGYENNSNIDIFMENANNDIREIKVVTKKFDNNNNLNNSKKLLTILSNVIPSLPIESVNINNFTNGFNNYVNSTNIAIEKARIIDPKVNNVDSLNNFLNVLTENLAQDSETGQYTLNYGNLSVQQYIKKIETENKTLLNISNQLDYPIRSNYDIVSARTLFQSIEESCINIMKLPRNKNIGISLLNLSNAINNLAIKGKAIDSSIELSGDVFTKINAISNILTSFINIIDALNISGDLLAIENRIKNIEEFRQNIIFYLSQFAPYSTEENAITTINDFKQFFGDRKFLTNSDLKSRLNTINTRIANFDSCISLVNPQYKYVSDDITFKQMLTDDINWLLLKQAPVFRSTTEMLSYRNGLAVNSTIGQSILNSIRAKLQYINNLEEVPDVINAMMNFLTTRFSTKSDYENHLLNMANNQLEMFNTFFSLRFNTKEELLTHLRSLESDSTMINNILIKLNKLSYINRSTLVSSMEKFNNFLMAINASQFMDIASLENNLNIIGAKQSTSNAIVNTMKARYTYITDENSLLTWANNHITLMENIISPIFVNSGQYINYITQLNNDANIFYTRREKWATIINVFKKRHINISNDDSLIELANNHDTLMTNINLIFSSDGDYVSKISNLNTISNKTINAIDILNDRHLYINNVDDLIGFANTHKTIMGNLSLTFIDDADYNNKISTLNNNALLLAARQPKWTTIINTFKSRHSYINNDDDLINLANIHIALFAALNKSPTDNNDYYNYITTLNNNNNTLTERSAKWTTIMDNFKKRHTYLSNDDSLIELSSSHDTLMSNMSLTFTSNTDYSNKILEFLSIRTKTLSAIDILNDRNLYVNNFDDLIGFAVTHRNIMSSLGLTFVSNNDYNNKISSLYNNAGDLSVRTLKWANIITVLNNRHNYINNDDDVVNFVNMHNALMDGLNYYPVDNADYYNYVNNLNINNSIFSVSKPKWDNIITNIKKKHVYIDNEDHLLDFSITHDALMGNLGLFLVNNNDYATKINNINSNAISFTTQKAKWNTIIDILNDRHAYIANEDNMISFVTSHRDLMAFLGINPSSNDNYTSIIQGLSNDSIALNNTITNISAAHSNVNNRSLLIDWSALYKKMILTDMALPVFNDNGVYVSTMINYKNSHSDISTVINDIKAIALDVTNNTTLKNWSNAQKNLILTTMQLGQFSSTANYVNAIQFYHDAMIKIKEVHSNVTNSSLFKTWTENHNNLIKTIRTVNSIFTPFANNEDYTNAIIGYKNDAIFYENSYLGVLIDYNILNSLYNNLNTNVNGVIASVNNNCGVSYVTNVLLLKDFINSLGSSIYNVNQRNLWRPGNTTISTVNDNDDYIAYLNSLIVS